MYSLNRASAKSATSEQKGCNLKHNEAESSFTHSFVLLKLSAKLEHQECVQFATSTLQQSLKYLMNCIVFLVLDTLDLMKESWTFQLQ